MTYAKHIHPLIRSSEERPLVATGVFLDDENWPLRVAVEDVDGRLVVGISRRNIYGSWYYDTLAGTSSLSRNRREPGTGLWINFGLKVGIDGRTMDEIMKWLLVTVGPPPFTPFDDDPDIPF